MSIFKSYISKSNTIQSEAYVNTARNPVIELNFGESSQIIPQFGFTRHVFDIDLTDLINNIQSGSISTGCTTGMTHTLKMWNTSSFDDELLNTDMSNGRKRATSFDLILFRIPLTSGDTGNPQEWDEGVGYDYNDSNLTKTTAYGGMTPYTETDYRAYSLRPSNWYQTTTIGLWSEPGIYSNTNEGNVNFSGLTIVGRQHFQLGNENLEIDMTDEINGILSGAITGVTGWGIAYLPDVENITGLTESYSVGFFSKYTNTFYQPYLETTYDDLILDNRNLFLKNQTNKLYLYVYNDGDFYNLDSLPTVSVEDSGGVPIPTLSALTPCLKTTGVYEVTIPNSFTGSPSPCVYYDVWSNLILNGESIPDITNQFVLQDYSAGIQIGTETKNTNKFAFEYYGILQDEKIIVSDKRKVGVTIKKAYTGQQILNNIQAYYRIYVKEGKTEVIVQDWTRINKSSNEYYFILDTTDKIPNQYFIDIKVNFSGQKDTYKRTLTFQIVNEK